MTHLIRRCLSMTAVFAILSSCIFDEIGDNFYRTLWVSSGEESSETVTLEFLCNGKVMVAMPSSLGSIGTYESQGMNAWFTNLTLADHDTVITISDAQREGDILYLHYSDNTDHSQNILEMHRLSSYPENDNE